MGEKTAQIRARMEPELKERAEAVIRDLGMTPSTAINVFYRQIALRKELPFEVSLPNEVTREAMKEAEEREGMTDADSGEELFELLDEE